MEYKSIGTRQPHTKTKTTKESKEKITEGLDGLGKRLIEYKKMGAVFTKWRAIIDIEEDGTVPSDIAIDLNCSNLARYAKIVQENEMVPIVEPEILQEGDHDIVAISREPIHPTIHKK